MSLSIWGYSERVQKIITVFQRNYQTDRRVRDEVVAGAEWVLTGEGIATRKWDGSGTMVRGGQLFKRLELKAGKSAPPGFEPMQEPDEVTGAVPGWVPVGEGLEDQWFRKAYANSLSAGDGHEGYLDDGTYEAVGPHFGGGHHDKNPEGLQGDSLVKHGDTVIVNFPRTFQGMLTWFEGMGMGAEWPSIEGVVFHHRDGRMAKIKSRDFGIRRPS